MKMLGISVAIIFVLGGISYWYYIDTQKTIATLTQNNAKLEVGIAENEKTIDSLRNDYSRVMAENQRINREYAEIRRQNNVLQDKLSNSDIGYLAATKPELIERLINSGTKNATRCFEILSGSPFTEEEINAKTDKQFNNECPWLWPGHNSGRMQ